MDHGQFAGTNLQDQASLAELTPPAVRSIFVSCILEIQAARTAPQAVQQRDAAGGVEKSVATTRGC